MNWYRYSNYKRVNWVALAAVKTRMIQMPLTYHSPWVTPGMYVVDPKLCVREAPKRITCEKIRAKMGPKAPRLIAAFDPVKSVL